MAKETAREEMLRKEKDFDELSILPMNMRGARKLINQLTGRDDFGTSLSKGAQYAYDEEVKDALAGGSSKITAKQSGRQAAREAAAEERREASRMGMKKGGSVKSSASARADGCAVRGKTKGRMI